jgi:hypothetical protein
MTAVISVVPANEASCDDAIEAYPMTTGNAIAEELHVGTEGVFAGAGFTEVSRPTVRRAVMRIEF